MSSSRTIGVGVIGLGFIGQMHMRACLAAEAGGLPCRLAAVCDSDERKLAGEHAVGNIGAGPAQPMFNATGVRAYRDPAGVLGDPSVDLVSICTYTDSHVDLGIAALGAGKHVLIEKPLAIRSSEVSRLAVAARRSATLCMPAMCMRFWPGWEWLHDRVEAGTFGSVHAASFQRLGSAPEWGAGFYRDASRSGGAMFDLHIHDVDFIYWCFGVPRKVHATGTAEHFTTTYHFGACPLYVGAEGGWSLAPGSPFRMRFVVTFDRAVADFDLGRQTPLLLHRNGEIEAIEIPSLTGYDGEMRHMIERIASHRHDLRATLDDALAVTQILECESASLREGCPLTMNAVD